MKTSVTPKKPSGTNAKGGATVVTLEMVAQLAGVSPSTVSRILNGTAVVSAKRKEAVDDAIAQLGFVPNPIARGLAGGKTLSIGVVTQAIDSPFYGAALRGIEDELDKVGYSSFFVSGHWDAVKEARCIEVLRSRRVDGIIVLTGRLADRALKDCAKFVPVVVTGRTLKAPGLFSLNFDNCQGGLLATQHLIELGHRHIAFIAGSPEHPDARERLLGYRTALEAAGLAYDEDLVVPGEYHEASGLEAVNVLLSRQKKFTAIFAANDQMASGAALGLHRHKLRVPHDVSLIGFDDLPASLYAMSPLSTVHQPALELGTLAAVAMLQLLAGNKPAVEVPLPRLVIRESTRRLLATS